MKSITGVFICCWIALAPLQGALCDDVPGPSGSAVSASRSVLITANTAWPTTPSPVRHLVARGVPNFGKLNDRIWRSGQPTRKGYELLAKEGIKTVVNLRAEFPQDKDLVPEGTRYIYLPIKDQHAPTVEQAKKFMEIASNPDNWPILVHCKVGAGRTGVMCALVRSSFDRWDHKKIMKEAGNFHLKIVGIDVPMVASQQRFIRSWEETADQADIQR